MSRWVWIAAALVLAGCANQNYRYDDDGYWTARPRAPTLVVSMGWGWGGCGAWGGSYYGPYHGYGYGYPSGYGWSPCGYGYGHGAWYGGGPGYWRDPYWSQPWYLPPRTIGPLPAGSRARHLANQPLEDLTGYRRYEDLATSRRRDLGGDGGAAFGAGRRGGAYYAPMLLPSPQGGIGSGSRGSAQYHTGPSTGLSPGRFDTSPGMSAGPRSSFDQHSSSAPRSGGFDAPPRNAAGAARSMSRESRDEE